MPAILNSEPGSRQAKLRFAEQRFGKQGKRSRTVHLESKGRPTHTSQTTPLEPGNRIASPAEWAEALGAKPI